MFDDSSSLRSQYSESNYDDNSVEKVGHKKMAKTKVKGDKLSKRQRTDKSAIIILQEELDFKNSIQDIVFTNLIAFEKQVIDVLNSFHP